MKLKSKSSGPFTLAFLGEGCGVATPLGNPILILRSRHSSGIMPSYLLYLAQVINGMNRLSVSVFNPRDEDGKFSGKGGNFVVFTVENNSPFIRDQDSFLAGCLRKVLKHWNDEGRRQTHQVFGR